MRNLFDSSSFTVGIIEDRGTLVSEIFNQRYTYLYQKSRIIFSTTGEVRLVKSIFWVLHIGFTYAATLRAVMGRIEAGAVVKAAAVVRPIKARKSFMVVNLPICTIDENDEKNNEDDINSVRTFPELMEGRTKRLVTTARTWPRTCQ